MLNIFICVEKVRLRDYINSVERFKTELISGVDSLQITWKGIRRPSLQFLNNKQTK